LNVLRKSGTKTKLRAIQARLMSFAARFVQYCAFGSRSKRVLFIEDLVPHGFLGAGFPRSNRMIAEMVRLGFAVTVYPASPFFENWTRVYQDISPKVEVVLGHGLPELERFLDKRSDYYDLLIVSRPHNMDAVNRLAEKSDCLRGMKVIYDAEAIFSLREIKRSEPDGGEAISEQGREMIRAELEVARHADAIISVSEAEARMFREHGYERVFTLGHPVEVAPTASAFESRQDILFVGAILDASAPNADALIWFSDEVLPLIRAQLCEVTLIVAGADTDSLAARLDRNAVIVRGRVDNLVPLYDAARVFVAPTRFGAGIPIKVYEAAAHGVPVATTALIANQLGWRNGVELLSADNAQGLAEACIALYRDSELWRRIRSNALDRVRLDCSRDAFAERLSEILHNALAERSNRSAH
jgi:glycosyltransferase involved in cell wall biosynthesis